jgi:hypothetical protein
MHSLSRDQLRQLEVLGLFREIDAAADDVVALTLEERWHWSAARRTEKWRAHMAWQKALGSAWWQEHVRKRRENARKRRAQESQLNHDLRAWLAWQPQRGKR